MIPLADRMRPRSLDEFVGDKHILSEEKLLFKAIKENRLFSMILWGPPGVGKTSLARLIANETSSQFLEFSAVTTGIAELKKLFEGIKTQNNVIARSDNDEAIFGKRSPRFARDDGSRPPVVFIDEIHRFNKAQQDAFLPYVENGTILLIGATTENPSFEIISPLLSRTRVFVLNPLSKEDLKEIVVKALKDTKRGLGNLKVKINDDAMEALLEISGGDARKALNALEVAVSSVHPSGGQTRIIKELIEEAYQHKALMYDKGGEEHYNTISSYIKSMRASNVDAALYYLARMVEAGEDPLFIARRMVVFASEDVASPTALVVANAVFQACQQIGFPECQENLAAGTVYMAQAKKDRSAYEAYMRALEDVKKYGNLPIPLKIRNAPTKLMKELGYGEGYEKYTKEDLLPEKLKGKKYYK